MNLHRLPFLAASLLAFSLAAQSPAAPSPAEVHGVRRADMDTSVSPCADFFAYANGTWAKDTKIPAEYPGWGGFYEIYERNIGVLHGILEKAAADKGAKPGSSERKVGDFYASGMDEKAIEAAGAKPLAPFFARIAALKERRGLAAEVARLRDEGAGSTFSMGIGQDPKESTRYVVNLSQDGLGLPDRDYYLKDDADSQALRAKYAAHVARMFALLGDKQAKAEADSVLAFETRLAKASRTNVALRDPQANYNKMSLAGLEQAAPGFGWRAYFGAMGLKEPGDLIVGQPEFLKEVGVMAQELPLAQWKAYLRWHLIHAYGRALSSRFVDEDFDFFGKTLNGLKAQRPRWKRVQANTDSALGEALGQLYVKEAFSPEAKAKALALVKNLQAALKERIEKLDWMGPETKQKALEKLAAFQIKIGYPDKWKDYSALEISRRPYVLNLIASARFEAAYSRAKLGRPIDRTEWGMTPPTVNAYYNPLMNEIVFPAGILQPPFFDPKADDAVNYGGIGMVIGHEMTHGFDDQGCQYDAQGNLKNWWTDADKKAYASRTDLVVKQYDAYEPLPGLHINGKLTLGENIADLGGLKIAYAAWQRSLGGQEAPVLDGFTGAQRFFLGYAQAWHALQRPEAMQVQVNTDPHSPDRFRVIGPLSDLPEFFQAFGCKEGDAMLKPEAERPAIW